MLELSDEVMELSSVWENEKKCLNNFHSILKKLEPTLIIIGKNVTNWAQDECKKAGAILVGNLKPK